MLQQCLQYPEGASSQTWPIFNSPCTGLAEPSALVAYVCVTASSKRGREREWCSRNPANDLKYTSSFFFSAAIWAAWCKLNDINVNLLRWMINDRDICSSNEQSLWCSTAGSINMHKEFTVTFAEASQRWRKKGREKSKSVWITAEMEMEDSFIFSSFTFAFL